MPGLFKQFRQISMHVSTSDEERRLQAKIDGNILLDFLKDDMFAALQSLRNVYQKGWPVYHEITDFLLQIVDPIYRSIVADILRFQLQDSKISLHIHISQLPGYSHFGLRRLAVVKVGPEVIPYLLEQNDVEELLFAIQSGPIEFNMNASIFNDFLQYLLTHEDVFYHIRQLALEQKNYRLFGVCQLILFLNCAHGQLTRRVITSNGLLCYENDFYRHYLEISKFWEGQYDYEPIAPPSLELDEEISYCKFANSYDDIPKSYLDNVIEQFSCFLVELQEQLVQMRPIDNNDIYQCITEYAMTLQHSRFDGQLLEIIAQIVVFLIEETYQQNDEEIKFRDQEKQYEVIYLLQSQYQYYNMAKEPILIPDYYEVMSAREATHEQLQFAHNLRINVGLLNGEIVDHCSKGEMAKPLGFTAVETRSSHPNQLFKIPADFQYLRLLSAFAKLIIVNEFGRELLDQINLSVSMLRFLIISIFQNETYNVQPRQWQRSSDLEYEDDPQGPKFVSYPSACSSKIYEKLNNVLYVAQTYPLVLQSFKTMQTPHPRVQQYNIAKIAQSSPYYKLQGLYEAPALSLYQFCFPMQRRLQFQNIFGIFKSSPSLTVFIFQPSLTIFLYNVVNRVPDSAANEHSRMIVDTVIHGLRTQPFLCKHESILLCLQSFLLVYNQMVVKEITSLQVLRFINTILSVVPLAELCMLLENLNTQLHTQLTAFHEAAPIPLDNGQLRDAQFGNCYAVTNSQLPCVSVLHSCFISAIEAYVEEVMRNPQEFDLGILINVLFMFRHQKSKNCIQKAISLSAQLFGSLRATYSGENKESLFNQRKYQLVSYLQSVQVFYNQYKIADPRVFDFDKLGLFTAEIRDFYYYQRIFKAQDLQLLRCFQSQIKHCQGQFLAYLAAAPRCDFADDIYDRLACAIRANGGDLPGIGEKCLFFGFLSKNGYFQQ